MAATKCDWDTCNILGSNISVYKLDEVVARMRSLIDEGRREYICISNVHTTVTGWQDQEFRRVTNEAVMATADGVPLIWASKIFKPFIHGRASGPDILSLFLQQDDQRQYRHFFFGSSPEVLSKMKAAIELQWPATKIVGMFSPPFGDTTKNVESDHIRLINESGAHVVWVGLGAPRQELWMARCRKDLNPELLLGVGAAFDFLAGTKPRAPRWMQVAGLEWAFRLLSEPRRLFKRYAVTNTVFIVGILQQFLKKIIKFD